MSNAGIRRERLLALLPRIYTAQPDNSAIGLLIEAMAAVLADLDDALERTLRDHWVTLAGGAPSKATEAGALELLGHLLGVYPLRWREPGTDGEEKTEATEAFRQRLLLTADILTRGLTTPRALLALTMITLGAELCSQVQSSGDTTLGWGMPLGTCRRCLVCQGIQQGDCPNAAGRMVDAWITDNPPVQQRREQYIDFKPDEKGGGSVAFTVSNASLVPDIPALTLRALDREICYPAVQNHTTHEICLFAGKLKAGERLSIWPQIRREEWSPFDSYEATNHHSWWRQYPEGSAVIIDSQGRLDDVSNSVYYLQGTAFDQPEAVFAGPNASEGVRFAGLIRGAFFDNSAALFEKTCFATSEPQVRTPQVLPGESRWSYQIVTKGDISAITGREGGNLWENAPEQATAAKVALTLSWWQRPLTTFRLRIPRNSWVLGAGRRGAVALLRDSVEQARAVGVRALVDFPEPVYRELQFFSEAGRLHVHNRQPVEVGLRESGLIMTVQAKQQEDHKLEDMFSLLGVFDTTRLNWTHLG